MLHLVVNPIAGRGRALRALERVELALRADGRPFDVHVTAAPRHATDIVMGLPAGATVVAVGGDGTVHEVALGCLARGFPMALLPTGSGDDFAFALGIDRRRLADALAALRNGATERSLDVGVVNDVPFVNGFGSGFDADVASRVLHAPRVYRGLGRYLYGIASAMRDFRLAAARVRVDGRTVHDGPALLVGVQNGPRAGGSFLFSPEARADDGLLDVVVAGAFHRLGTLGVLPRVMRGTHLRHPRIALVRGREVEVDWSSPVVAHVDGEALDAGAGRFRIETRAGALRVLDPAAVAASAASTG